MVYGMGCGEACNRLWDVARYWAWHGMGYGRAVRYGMVWEMVRYGIWYGTLYGVRCGLWYEIWCGIGYGVLWGMVLMAE